MNEQTKQRVQTAVMWGAGIIGMAVVSPIIFLALKGALGALALAVAGAAGVAMMRLAPWFGAVTANLGMKLFMNEAAKNPIETMQNLRAARSAEIIEADSAIADFEAEIANFADETRAFKEDYPDEAPRYEEILDRMKEALKGQKEAQRDARDELADLEQRISKAEAIFKMALAAEKVTKLSGQHAKRIYQEIAEKVAFDSVRAQMNKSSAKLTAALSQRREMSSLPPKHAAPVIDITPVKEKVSR